MSRQWRWSMKNALASTLSHPPHPPPTPPPETPTTNTQRMNTYVTSMKMIHEERTSKNVIYHTPPPPHPPPPPPPETPPTNTQRMNTYVTSMKMIHEERTSKNVITPPHPPTPPPTPPKPPQPTPSVWTPMSRQWRWSMKNALARTLSHPTPPLAQLRLYFKRERNIESVLRLYFEGARRICSSSCTPPHP